MRAGLYLVIVALLMGSCSAERRLSRLLSNHPELMEVDTVETIAYRDTIIYRDTVIGILLPRDTVKSIDTILIECNEDSLFISNDTIKAETEIAIAYSWIDTYNQRASINLIIQNKESFQIKLDSVITERKYWETKYLEAIKTVKIKYCPLWKSVMAWVGVVFIILIIIGVILGVRNSFSFNWFNK